jgi:thiamine phosphate synthase YjbQ (UPF0047 family)
MYITASVFINDDERGLHQDYERWLEKLPPHEPVSGYQHNRTAEKDADTHMKRQVMGREVVVAITRYGPRPRTKGTGSGSGCCQSQYTITRVSRDQR